MRSELKRLKQLEEKSGKFKKTVADLSLDMDLLQDISRRKP
jgi:putative transposase